MLLVLMCGLFACDRGEPAGAGKGTGGAGDGAEGGGGGSKPYTVVATVAMIADIASAVAGERATVSALIGQGVDPHLYKPTSTDVGKLMGADVILYNGLLLEGRMTDALVRLASAGKKVHAVTELLEESELLSPPGLAGHHDPHVWMDPLAWSKAVEVVRAKLTEFDPPGAGLYASNAKAYQERLTTLHEYCVTALATVPEKSRVLVTAHDAFNYMGRRYGYEVVGIQGLSTESEAGVRDIENLVELLVSRDAKAVFVESTVSQRNIEALIAGCRARGHTVTIGGQLYSDAMGAAGTHEGTYVGMIDHNVTTIARALGGEAPERGMEGKLGGVGK
ncbi:MAG: zinc ABC transporter substrate-binding protein [Phycisphaerales bacterium]|nr:zinc ABC transporter substrate-binding protein [Phycisphaerales bacterium]